MQHNFALSSGREPVGASKPMGEANMTSLTFQREEYLRRVQLLEANLERAGFDALIAYSVKNDGGSVVYLTGYEPGLGLHDVAFFVAVPNGNPRYALITNAFWDNPQKRTWVENVLITSDFGTKLLDVIPDSVRRIGIAGYSFFPAPVYATLRAARPAMKIEDATGLLMDIAKVKSSEEIAVIRRCVDMTDAGGRAFLTNVREGVNEREIKVEVERAIMLAGSDGLWYNFQLYSGPQVAVGMGLMTGRTLAKGEQVQVDCGALYCGYRGDFSRVTSVGPPSRHVHAIMETTAEMYEAMLRKVCPGVPISEVAVAGLAVAKSRGMDSYLYRSPNPPASLFSFMGHGLSCWTHGFPTIHVGAQDLLEKNMVLVLEPILGRPGVGGAKIEDAILVTSHGGERLSELEIRTWPAPAN
jgi:Xaa-Pro aminopeptidase